MFVLILLIAGGMAWITFPIGAGYGAKIMCSCVFLGDRDEASVWEDELSILKKHLSIKVNRMNETVEASMYGRTKKAIYRPGKGCTLENGEVKEHAYVPLRKATSNARFEPWPYGDDISAQQLPDFIDMDRLNQALDSAFAEPYTDKTRNTRAVIVLYDSLLVAERYATGFSKTSRMAGWSMTKTVTNALYGILSKQNKIDIHQPAPMKEWKKDSMKSQITIDHLLRMSSGLDFLEFYFGPTDATFMLFTEHNAGKFAAKRAAIAPPDSIWSYSSGTTNILSQIIRQTLPESEYHAFPQIELFDKLGMQSAIMETDASGTHIGSSFMFATARDWARFGLLYQQDGVFRNERILPEGWVKYSTTPTPPAPQGKYGAQIWLNAGKNGDSSTRPHPSIPANLFWASGFEGQYVIIAPTQKVTIVRLGQTIDRSAFDFEKFVYDILAAFPSAAQAP